MKLSLGLIGALGAGALLAGCGGAYGGGGIGYGYGYGPGPVALADCGGFYDGFYGDIDDGCWGSDGAYWYHGGYGWRRDSGGHFSHVAANNMHAFHGHGPGAGQHFGGGGHGGGHHP
jgi:hypothetical protein